MGPNQIIADAVDERAHQLTAEAVRMSCSLAQAERLLGREYHGRFLIELVQNGSDAWRKGSRSRNQRSRMVIALTEGPALMVANQGEPFPVSAVVESLGHIGASTKHEGEAIGHKGIGFKSVLEITLTPELYSNLQSPDERLALRFDRSDALQAIRRASPEWDRHVLEIDAARDDPLVAVPVLRFPQLVSAVPADVEALADLGFDTVIRLPFDPSLHADHELDEELWLRTVRDALADVTDQMLLLLGTFDEVKVEDRIDGEVVAIAPKWTQAKEVRPGVTCEVVSVERNGAHSSRWRLYRESLSEKQGLSGEIAVGLKLSDGDSPTSVIPLSPDELSAPFQLFFPTRIPSGFPLLLHGYFKVNAARTGFYAGNIDENQTILDGLSELLSVAVHEAAASGDVDVASLANLLGEIGIPEDAQARRFRNLAFDLLDEVEWIPLHREEIGRDLGSPPHLLVDEEAQLVSRIVDAFPPMYIQDVTSLDVPGTQIDEAGHRFLASRRRADAPDIWEILGTLFRPGNRRPWEPGTEDEQFKKLLDLVAALLVHDATATNGLLAGLRRDSASRLLPTVGAVDGSRVLLPINDPAEEAGRSLRVMARSGRLSQKPLIPPDALQVAFLADGLLDEAQVDQAKPLGVRPFTVDNVLDRLGGIAETIDPPETLVGFLWGLLARETRSEFGTRNCAQQAETFDPSMWFWCQPGRGDADRPRQQRASHLASVRLPARDNSWQPAGSLAFGADWADWLGSGACGATPAASSRIDAYRALDEIRPSDAKMLASPEVVLALLPENAMTDGDVTEESDQDDPADLLAQQARERHAFLLRLGVWEVIPVEGFDNATTRDRPNFPWTGHLQELRLASVSENGGWKFQGRHHQHVYASTDFRMAWSLEEAARKDADALTRLLATGSGLYSTLTELSVFCPGCSDRTIDSWHRTHYRSSAADAYPSLLSLELRNTPWVSAVLDGKTTDEQFMPREVWWTPAYPLPAGLRQSPLRYLKVCHPTSAFTHSLRDLCGITELGDADPDEVLGLLEHLQHEFDQRSLVVDPRTSSGARQAFLGLHRLAYSRLAQLAPEDPVIGENLEEIGVLCEIGGHLGYRKPAEARHDNGRYTAYRRFFGAAISFVEIAKDRAGDATSLGVPPFGVHLVRRGTGDGRDVTDDLSYFLFDRIPDLLAILVHHSLGTQTLELGSAAFEARANRMHRLRVRQLDDLIIDATVEGTSVNVAIGVGTDQDLFLEGPTRPTPVLYHDLRGDGWEEILRRKIAPHLAILLESPAYSATFELYLLRDGEAEREAALQDLGITNEDVEGVKTAIGIVSEQDRIRSTRWFGAILDVLNGTPLAPKVTPEQIVDALIAAGLPGDAAQRLHELGDVVAREDVSPDGSLAILVAAGVDLATLNARLRALGDAGLDIRVAATRLRAWLQQHEQRLAAVLATTGMDPEKAKAEPATWGVPDSALFLLDPAPEHWLSAVLGSLLRVGFQSDANALATTPAEELARLADVESLSGLDDLVSRLYDEEERLATLARFAATWRRHLVVLGILSRMNVGDGRAAIRGYEAAVEGMIPVNPPGPASLQPAVVELFADYAELPGTLISLLRDSLGSPPPDRESLLQIGGEHGLRVEQLDAVLKAIEAPRNARVQRIRADIATLTDERLAVAFPSGLKPAETKPVPPLPPGPRPIRTIKAGGKTDQRKRDAGDDAERWALAALVRRLVELSIDDRQRAVDSLVVLLEGFKGPPVDAAIAHAIPACNPHLDQDELVDELSRLIHVSPYSDAFGFDMVGWLAPHPGADPRAMCIEVKGTGGRDFHLSMGEWRLAKQMNVAGDGEAYAVLVVRRPAAGGAPEALDLLTDPVHLVESGQLVRADDGYIVTYDVG